MPRDRGDIAFEDINKLFDKIRSELDVKGDIDIMFKPEGVKGLILVDLRNVIKNLPPEKAENISNTIWGKIIESFDKGELLSVSKIRRIHKIVPTDIDDIEKQAEFFAKYIDSEWKIDIHTKKIIDRTKTIRSVASHINQPVNLKNPRYILYIEVIGPTITVMYLVDTKNVRDTILRY